VDARDAQDTVARPRAAATAEPANTGAHVDARDAQDTGAHPSAAATAEPANTGAHVDARDAQGTGARPRAAASAEPANTGAHVDARDAQDKLAHPRAAATEPANTGAHVDARDAQDRRAHPRAMSTGKPTNCDGPAASLDIAELCVEAKVALRQMGWKPAIAQAAVRAAASILGQDATLERVLVEALRRCPRPAETSAPMTEHDGRSF
jgi:hypothetical protein